MSLKQHVQIKSKNKIKKDFAENRHKYSANNAYLLKSRI